MKPPHIGQAGTLAGADLSGTSLAGADLSGGNTRRVTDVAKVLAYEAAFERWMAYERECLLANRGHLTFAQVDIGAPPDIPTVTIRRDQLLSFRAGYMLLRNAVAELLDLDPEEMTQLQVIGAIAQKRWSELKDAREDDEP